MMGKFFAGGVFLSLVCSVLFGKTEALASATIDGASASIELCLSMAGVIMLWCGIMEVARRSGLMNALSKIITPIIGFLFPGAKRDRAVMSDICANVSANLLGLGNAATPAGIRAAEGLHRLSGSKSASDDMCMLVVINTASLQLIPTTIGAMRASCGAENPFDIILAVWFASLCSIAAGIVSAKFLSRLYRR